MGSFLAKLAGASKHHSHVGHLLLTSLFVASAVHLVEHQLPLDVPARKLVSQWAAGSISSGWPRDAAAGGDLAVLKIDRERFVSFYGGQSPLSRCKLYADIKDILAAGPHLRDLALDFDLSPTGRTAALSPSHGVVVRARLCTRRAHVSWGRD